MIFTGINSIWVSKFVDVSYCDRWCNLVRFYIKFIIHSNWKAIASYHNISSLYFYFRKNKFTFLTFVSWIANCIADSVSKFDSDVPILVNLSTSAAISSCDCFTNDSFSLQCSKLSQDESNSGFYKKNAEKETKNKLEKSTIYS